MTHLEPNIGKWAFISAIVHIALLMTAIEVFKHSQKPIRFPAYYEVSLESPDSAVETVSTIPSETPKAEAQPVVKDAKYDVSEDEERHLVASKINLLRRSLDSKKASEKTTAPAMKTLAPTAANQQNSKSALKSQGKGDAVTKNIGPPAKYPTKDSYAAYVKAQIKNHWTKPPIDAKGLSVVLIITITKEGFIKKTGIEKPSGSDIFDESAMRALNKLSRVEPPAPGLLDSGIKGEMEDFELTFKEEE